MDFQGYYDVNKGERLFKSIKDGQIIKFIPQKYLFKNAIQQAMLSLPASSHHHIIIDPFDNTAPIILLILLTMSYVKQICGGYNKQSLLGNWLEERLYPSQPFREQQQKQARDKDEGITCFDQTGLQRALPRIQRRSKWETAGRIVLDDGYNMPNTTTKASYGYEQLATAKERTIQPFSKNFSQVFSTELHPHSQVRVNQQQHRLLNHSTIEQIRKERPVAMSSNHYNSKLPATAPHEKYTNYVSQYKLNFTAIEDREKPDLNKGVCAGDFNPNPQEAVRSSTTLIGEYKKDADEKEATKVQRSWVPPKDKSLIFGARETVRAIKASSIPENDIQTSLNMNIGIHNIHPKNVPDNYFAHKLSEITRNMNANPCRR